MTTPRVTVPVDTFNGDNVALAASISALLEAPDASLSARVPGMAKQLLASAAARLSAAPAPEGGAVDWDAKDQELIERGLRTIRTHDAVRYLREALTATTVRLTGYDWNADPDGVTKQQGDAFAAADRVFADLDAAVASHPEIELPECQTCGGTGKIEEAARMEGANKHSACIRTCDDCDGCGFAPDDEPAALATREEAPAEAGEFSDALLAFLFRHGIKVALDVSEIEALRQTALRAQPPAREDAQPVASAYRVRPEMNDPEEWTLMHPERAFDYLDRPGWETQPLYTHPAPDALRVAVEALEKIKRGEVTVFDDELQCNVVASMDGEEASEIASEALAALQAEQKGGA